MHHIACMHARELKAEMKKAGLDARGLAAATGIHMSLVGRYLRGEVAIGARNAVKVAAALKVTVERVLYD